MLYAGVPSLLNLLAIVVALAYPIDRLRHRQILEAIEARRHGHPVLDPLRPSPSVGATS
jgi:Na+/melibiose symporter-like transporter